MRSGVRWKHVLGAIVLRTCPIIQHDCICFYLYEYFGRNQSAYFNHACSRSDSSKELAMGFPYLFPIINVDDSRHYVCPCVLPENFGAITHKQAPNAPVQRGLRSEPSAATGCYAAFTLIQHPRTLTSSA